MNNLVERGQTSWASPRSRFHLRMRHALDIIKFGEECDRFGDYLNVHCTDWPFINGHGYLMNTKFTRPVSKFKSLDIIERRGGGCMAHFRRDAM